jgi:hypothetical protein
VIRVALWIGIMLAIVCVVSLGSRDDVMSDRPKPVVRAEQAGGLAELRDAVAIEVAPPAADPAVEHERPSTALARTQAPAPADSPAPGLGGRDLDHSEATVRRVLALYARLEVRP